MSSEETKFEKVKHTKIQLRMVHGNEAYREKNIFSFPWVITTIDDTRNFREVIKVLQTHIRLPGPEPTRWFRGPAPPINLKTDAIAIHIRIDEHNVYQTLTPGADGKLNQSTPIWSDSIYDEIIEVKKRGHFIWAVSVDVELKHAVVKEFLRAENERRNNPVIWDPQKVAGGDRLPLPR